MSGDARPPVRLELTDAVACVVLDRPERRNSLGEAFSSTMEAVLAEIEAHPDVGAAILTGTGTTFCAGGDLNEIMSTGVPDSARDLRLIEGFNRVIARLRRLPVPTVAAVNGPAVGGGAALALACDMAIAADEAQYVFGFGRVGLTGADMGCAHLLQRAIGPMRAAHLLFTDGSISAEQGHALGVFVDVVPRAELQEAAEQVASRIAAGPRRANAATKTSLRRGESMDFDAVLDYETHLQARCFADEEHKERLAGILAKRLARQ